MGSYALLPFACSRFVRSLTVIGPGKANNALMTTGCRMPPEAKNTVPG
jgi:hypothetical protein